LRLTTLFEILITTRAIQRQRFSTRGNMLIRSCRASRVCNFPESAPVQLRGAKEARRTQQTGQTFFDSNASKYPLTFCSMAKKRPCKWGSILPRLTRCCSVILLLSAPPPCSPSHGRLYAAQSRLPHLDGWRMLDVLWHAVSLHDYLIRID
jgi:hypothetical protein